MAKRMLLVSEDAMKRLQPQQIPAAASARDSLDSEMNEILSNHSIPPEEKWKLYQQVLHRYLGVKDEPVKVEMTMPSKQEQSMDIGAVKQQQPLELKARPAEEGGYGDIAYRYAPTRFRNKVKQICDFISNN